ncbi:unnamed protein product [Arabidopsis halleri]
MIMKETNSHQRLNTVVVVVRSFVAVLVQNFFFFLAFLLILKLFSFLLMILSILRLLLMFNVFDFICEIPNHIRSRERKVFSFWSFGGQIFILLYFFFLFFVKPK